MDRIRRAKLVTVAFLMLIVSVASGCSGLAASTPRATPTPSVEDKAAQIKGHLTAAMLAYADIFGIAAAQNLNSVDNPAMRYQIKIYLEGLVKRARNDDTLALYLIWMAPALDACNKVHVSLTEDRFLDPFSLAVAKTGNPPLQVLSLLTEGERNRYDYYVKYGPQNQWRFDNSRLIYASLR